MRNHRVIALAIVAVAAMGRPLAAPAQSFAPYADFQSMSLSELSTLQVKLTDVGPSLKRAKTLVFTTASQPYNLTVFGPYYRPQFLGSYSGDLGTPSSFRATAAQLKAAIDSVATLPGVTDGDVDTDGVLSFSLHNIVGGTPTAFEAVLSKANGSDLFGKLMAALAANDSARAELNSLACDVGMLAGNPPQDVTAQVTIRMKGVRQDRQTGYDVGVIRVTNSSGSTIGGPITLVVVPNGNVRLVSSDGLTCAISPSGVGYVNLPVPSGLLPNKAVEVKLRFDNPDSEPITFVQRKVLAGPGTR